MLRHDEKMQSYLNLNLNHRITYIARWASICCSDDIYLQTTHCIQQTMPSLPWYFSLLNLCKSVCIYCTLDAIRFEPSPRPGPLAKRTHFSGRASIEVAPTSRIIQHVELRWATCTLQNYLQSESSNTWYMTLIQQEHLNIYSYSMLQYIHVDGS